MRTDTQVDHLGIAAILTRSTADAQCFGGTLAVEPDCVDAVVDGAKDAELR